MNDVKIFCPNCQEGVNTRAVTESYSMFDRVAHVGFLCLAVFVFICELFAIILIFPLFFMGRTIRWIKSELMIVTKGVKSEVYVCEKCSVIL